MPGKIQERQGSKRCGGKLVCNADAKDPNNEVSFANPVPDDQIRSIAKRGNARNADYQGLKDCEIKECEKAEKKKGFARVLTGNRN